MLKLCFYQRLALSLVAGFVLMLIGFLYLSSQSQVTLQKHTEQALHRNLAQHLVTDNPLLSQGVTDYASLQNLFHTQMVLGPSFEFYFIDPNGVIITFSGDTDTILQRRIDMLAIQTMLNPQAELPIYGTDPKQSEATKIFSVAPVYDNAGLQGYVYVIIGGAKYDSLSAKLSVHHTMQSSFYIAIGSILFLLFALLILFKFFTTPLKLLSQDMQTIRADGFNLANSRIALKPWREDSFNEVQQLGFSFNAMVKHIQYQMQQLTHIDEQRKHLLTDISHDLRTPLANLQGYIETLSLQYPQLDDTQRQTFIDISLKNLRNMKHLIDQIFELAYLESGHIKLNNEVFSITELLHDVVAKFAIKAEQAKVILNIDVAHQVLLVDSDVEKIERVLTNLIDNAIRHTPPDGQVCLKTHIDQQQIIIAVCDTGVGIDPEDLPHIFTARYQGSNQQSDQQTHGGLGLAICAQLIAKLGSELNVESKVGQGAQFSFALTQVHL